MNTRSTVTALALCTLCLVGAAGCNQIGYGFDIDPGQTLALGGADSGSFSASTRLDGAGQVEVSRMDPDGTREHIGLATMTDRVQCRCPAGVAVVFENVGVEPAHVDIDITGHASLSLPYDPRRRAHQPWRP